MMMGQEPLHSLHHILFCGCPFYDSQRINPKPPALNSLKIGGDIKKVLERYTNKNWPNRQEGKVRAGGVPPKRLMELCDGILVGITKCIIIHLGKLDVAPYLGEKKKIASKKGTTTRGL